MGRLLSYRNRHALALLGVYVLGYGLVVAPLWHAVVEHAGVALSLDSPWVSHEAQRSAHADLHEHGHGHGGEQERGQERRSHTHAPHALEHLATVFVAAAPPQAILVAFTAPCFLAPQARPAFSARERHPAMPQGP